MSDHFLGLLIYETFIYFRRVFYLNCFMGKKVQKNFRMGLKIWWSQGWGKKYHNHHMYDDFQFFMQNFNFFGLRWIRALFDTFLNIFLSFFYASVNWGFFNFCLSIKRITFFSIKKILLFLIKKNSKFFGLKSIPIFGMIVKNPPIVFSPPHFFQPIFLTPTFFL